jgi:hypothetical protein
MQKEFSEYEQRFRADIPDPKWAAPAEQNLVDAATDPALTALSTPKTFKADCAGHKCKVQMHFDTLSQAQDWSELYVVGMAPAVSLVRSTVAPVPNGGADLILFGVRHGSEQLLRP